MKTFSATLHGLESVLAPVTSNTRFGGGVSFHTPPHIASSTRSVNEAVGIALTDIRQHPLEEVRKLLDKGAVVKHGGGFLPCHELAAVVSAVLAILGIATVPSTEPGEEPIQNLSNVWMLFGSVRGGGLRHERGALSAALLAKKLGMRGIVAPLECAGELSAIDGFEVMLFDNVRRAVDFAIGSSVGGYRDLVNYIRKEDRAVPEVARIKVSNEVKKALVICAVARVGLHLVSEDGTPLTYLARVVAGLLPPLTREESLEATLAHSAAGTLQPGGPCVSLPPFRAPHFTVSEAGLRGSNGRAGELSLAHLGVLYLDDAPEFSWHTLGTVSQAKTEGYSTPYGQQFAFLTSFVLVVGSQACPCRKAASCACTPERVEGYRKRAEALDRHLYVTCRVKQVEEVMPWGTSRLQDMMKRGLETKVELNVPAIVDRVRELFPTRMTPVDLIKIAKVTLAIAAIDGSTTVTDDHIVEAVSYVAAPTA